MEFIRNSLAHYDMRLVIEHILSVLWVGQNNSRADLMKILNMGIDNELCFILICYNLQRKHFYNNLIFHLCLSTPSILLTELVSTF